MRDLGKGLAMLLAQKHQGGSEDERAGSSAGATPGRGKESLTKRGGDAETAVPGENDVEMTGISPRSPLVGGSGGGGGGGGRVGGSPGGRRADAPLAASLPSGVETPEGDLAEAVHIPPQAPAKTRAEPAPNAPQLSAGSNTATHGAGEVRNTFGRQSPCEGGEGCEENPSASARESNREDGRARSGSSGGEPGGRGSGSNGKDPQRRSMQAPPMSPPKVIASAENDPQLDCTLKTLEAVHGAFYAPDYHHGQPR